MSSLEVSGFYRVTGALCTVFVLAAVSLLAGCRTSGSGTSATWSTFSPQPPPAYRYPEGIRLATLNTEFLFDGVGREGEANFPRKGDSLAARRHRDRVARIIRWIDPHVIVLQEVENENTLNLLLAESLSDMAFSAHLIPGRDFFTGQNVAVLSRLPVDEVERTDMMVRAGPGGHFQNVSKNIIVRLDLAGIPTTLIGVHFLARPDDPNRKDKREAQAEIIRRVAAEEIDQGRAVAVVGDFNDFDAGTRDIAGNQPITNVMQTIRSAGPGPHDDLHNVMADIPQSKRFTSHWDRNENEVTEATELSAVDHILLSPELYRRVREVQFIHSHDPAAVTDHFPIVVGLESR